MNSQEVARGTAIWRRLAKAVLYLNIALVVLIALPAYLLHVGPGAAVSGSGIVSREYGVLHVGYLAMCVMVLALFERDRRWLLVPPLFLVPIWLAAINEVIAYHSTADVPPVVLRAILIAGYLAAYMGLVSKRREAAASVGREQAPQATH